MSHPGVSIRIWLVKLTSLISIDTISILRIGWRSYCAPARPVGHVTLSETTKRLKIGDFKPDNRRPYAKIQACVEPPKDSEKFWEFDASNPFALK